MSLQNKKEDFLIQIRDKLRRDEIKLWLEPYFVESTGPSLEVIKSLAQNYSGSINIPYDDCYDIILELQSNSIENLKQRSRFKESGLATIKIKILNQNSPPTVISKEILLSLRGCDLKSLINKDINVPDEKIKLINSGKILNDHDSLVSQGVKNGQQVLALILSESPKEAEDNENQTKELEGIKTDSRLLALDSAYMQLEDQFGNPIKIPPNEKKALVVAMTLQEKGKSALKREDYTRALIFFLEADEEYKSCNSQLLKTVDNYALLDLDIAWCYLCLESVANLPEAFERLKRCEETFHKTYGSNLERLIAVKGTPGNEAVLFMRLHLLQAIVLYHQNKRSESLALLRKTLQELESLKVDDTSVVTLVELGYSVAEARLGLRATNGDVNLAANHINENREKRRESRRKAMAEEILEKERKVLGRCEDNKQFVDPNFLKILVNMGYNKEAARQALQKNNNVISDAIQFIQENPSPGPSGTKSQEMMALINDLIPELEAAGFSTDMAQLALHKHMGDVMKAAEDLLLNNGVVDYDPSLIKELAKYDQMSDKDKKKKERKDEAFKRLAEDISMVDDDHLDYTLENEENFVKKYLSLLEQNFNQ